MSSILIKSTKALVAQLVEVFALEANQCQFESDRGYQNNAGMEKLVNLLHLKCNGASLGGSSPSTRTK